MTEAQPSLLEFPCDFPIKAFGQNGEAFAETVLNIVRTHAPEVDESAVVSRPSKGGKYTAVTVMVRARSQAQLDAIYQDLTKSPDVMMAL
jgi:putative lipoic acid-binding regulatory protein